MRGYSVQVNIGDRFGKLVIIEEVESRWYKLPSGRLYRVRMVKCKCDCDNETTVSLHDLRTEHTASCGCSNIKHGLYGHRLYNVWRDMKKRCYNPKRKLFHRYGGRGITVCEEWIDDFKAFHDWAMDNGYREGLQIDRIDNNKGYFPDNCRFVTHTENQQNREMTIVVTFHGLTTALSAHCRRLGLRYDTVLERIKRNWSVERALSTATQ